MRKPKATVIHSEIRIEGERQGIDAAISHVRTMIQLCRAHDRGLEDLDRALRNRESAESFYMSIGPGRGLASPRGNAGYPRQPCSQGRAGEPVRTRAQGR